MLLHGMDELSQVKDTANWHQLAFGGIVFWALIHDRKSTLALDAKPLFLVPSVLSCILEYIGLGKTMVPKKSKKRAG
jgi:hypothetical protein